MPLAYTIYVTRQGADDKESTVHTMRALGGELRPRYEAGELRGYDLVAVTSDEDYEEHEIDREWTDEEVGPPPFLYATVTWNSADPVPDLADVVQRFALRELLTATTPR